MKKIIKIILLLTFLFSPERVFSSEKIRIQAKKMTELAANLRKKYNC